MRMGPSPTWFESLLLGEGLSQRVPLYEPALIKQGSVTLNPDHVRAWKQGHACVWRAHSVWGYGAQGEPVLLEKDYFRWRRIPGGGRVKVDMERDYFVPFVLAFKRAVNEGAGRRRAAGVGGSPGTEAQAASRYLVFLDRDTDFEDPHASHCPLRSELGQDPAAIEGLVWAPHWYPLLPLHSRACLPLTPACIQSCPSHRYDLVPLATKSFRAWIGITRAGRFPVALGNRRLVADYEAQLLKLRECGAALGAGKGVPTLIGEIGIPFDFNGGEAYRTGDFGLQISAMDTTMRALERALLSATLWNYAPDNTNEHADGWNGEDLSIYSRDQVVAGNEGDAFAGGRALHAIIRPYAQRCAGTPLAMDFDMLTRVFSLRFEHDPAVPPTAPTLLFVPLFQYPEPPRVEVSDGSYVFDQHAQTLEFYHNGSKSSIHTLILRPARDTDD